MARKIPPMPSRENLKFHDSLSMEGLLKIIHGKMAKVSDYRTGTPEYSMSNVLMSGLAVFGLKYPSLLQFDKNKDKLRIKHTSEPCMECVAPRATARYGRFATK
jgi:hypothetical protein